MTVLSSVDNPSLADPIHLASLMETAPQGVPCDRIPSSQTSKGGDHADDGHDDPGDGHQRHTARVSTVTITADISSVDITSV